MTAMNAKVPLASESVPPFVSVQAPVSQPVPVPTSAPLTATTPTATPEATTLTPPSVSAPAQFAATRASHES